MTYPPYWQEAIEYLAAQDRVMANLIASYPHERMLNHHNPFHTLVKAIVGQQISVKAASAIGQRLESLLGTFSPKHYLAAAEDQLRQCGLSRQKIAYITNVARALEQGKLTPLAWPTMSDEEVVKQLISIKGIGTWTAQMFLIFYLHRPDVLPLGDVGLLKAIAVHYASGKELTIEDIVTISQSWKPYRTVATWYLWRTLDPIGVQY